MSDPRGYDALSAAVLLVGLYEGVLPFAAKLFDWSPALSLPRHLDAPWWWIVSGAVVVAAIALLEVIDRAKQRA